MIEIPIWLFIVSGILFGLGFILILMMSVVLFAAYRSGRKKRAARGSPVELFPDREAK